MMRITGLILGIVALLVLVSGCDRSGARVVASEQGAWLGKGVFSSSQGSQQVTAQLEVLADGTYRFAVIEPPMLFMVVGLEEGTWQRSGDRLNLSPYPDQVTTGTGIMNRAPKNFSRKSLTIEGENAAFVLKDEQMDLRFTRNESAEESLRENGEIR